MDRAATMADARGVIDARPHRHAFKVFEYNIIYLYIK